MQHTQANPHEPGAAAPDPGRLLRLPAVLGLVGLGRTAWLERVRTGDAPKMVKCGRASMWVESEVRAWIADRIRATRGGKQ